MDLAGLRVFVGLPVLFAPRKHCFAAECFLAACGNDLNIAAVNPNPSPESVAPRSWRRPRCPRASTPKRRPGPSRAVRRPSGGRPRGCTAPASCSGRPWGCPARRWREVDGEPCPVVRTANTITLRRSWPERHVQVILHYLPSLEAPLRGPGLHRQGRAGAAPGHQGPGDQAEPVAAYTKRGFAPCYLEDRAVDPQRLRTLAEEVAEHFVFEKKLLDFSAFQKGIRTEATAIEIMASSNTSYSQL